MLNGELPGTSSGKMKKYPNALKQRIPVYTNDGTDIFIWTFASVRDFPYVFCAYLGNAVFDFCLRQMRKRLKFSVKIQYRCDITFGSTRPSHVFMGPTHLKHDVIMQWAYIGFAHRTPGLEELVILQWEFMGNPS